ncbi:hypothetical protein ElyMa_004659300 [Elysia marginata]|uniref:F5/8 type C domain-containing protein n=1 Tax=Elysia marginata TaxID=1093978 RepID=A0AAV4I1W1_9GAST|nr:hypothetical protein ElyMa_004659300 [Elysia marginata]
MKTVYEGKLEGKRNRGRPSASLVSNMVTVSGMSLHKMVWASQDRDGWRKIVNLSAAANTASGETVEIHLVAPTSLEISYDAVCQSCESTPH